MASQRPRVSLRSTEERFPSHVKTSLATETAETGSAATSWKTWVAGGLVAAWLIAIAVWLWSPASAQEVVLRDLEDLSYRYRILQQKKLDGTDWEIAAEPLQEQSLAVRKSIDQLEDPQPELVEAAATLEDVLRKPKRPDPRLETVDAQLETARQAIAQAE